MFDNSKMLCDFLTIYFISFPIWIEQIEIDEQIDKQATK